MVNEVYLSLQGESTFAGLPCIFIRLTACNLRCSYCDTAYAFKEGEKRTIEEVLKDVKRLAEPYVKAPAPAMEGQPLSCQSPLGCYRLPLVELTGGEPLL